MLFDNAPRRVYALLALARQLPGLLGHAVPGQVLQAGKRTELRPCRAAA